MYIQSPKFIGTWCICKSEGKNCPRLLLLQ